MLVWSCWMRRQWVKLEVSNQAFLPFWDRRGKRLKKKKMYPLHNVPFSPQKGSWVGSDDMKHIGGKSLTTKELGRKGSCLLTRPRIKGREEVGMKIILVGMRKSSWAKTSDEEVLGKSPGKCLSRGFRHGNLWIQVPKPESLPTACSSPWRKCPDSAPSLHGEDSYFPLLQGLPSKALGLPVTRLKDHIEFWSGARLSADIY